MLKEYKLTEINQECLKVWGRGSGRLDPLPVFWTGGGIELNVKAAELWVEVETGSALYETWAAVLLDGDLISRQMLPGGRGWVCLFRGMNPNTVKNLRLLRETQAMPHDPETRLFIHSIKTDGSLEPVAERPYKIEFVGDSITTGEGLVGAKEVEDWVPMIASAVYGFPQLVSEAVNAEYRVVSQSGWGVISGWDNDPNSALPPKYCAVCGLVTGGPNVELGAYEPYDFAGWPADAVVVNLGTNDGGALSQPEWTDPATGETFRQTADPAGRAAFQKGVTDFLKLLREKNPGAWLVWAYGMCGPLMSLSIREAICQYQEETGDRRVTFILLPDTTEETLGSREHPGKKAHENAARVLAENLKALLAKS